MLSEIVELEFLKKFEDKTLRVKLAACKSPEEALAVVKAEGFDIGLQDFKESMRKLNAYFNPKSGELSDSDLESVAGGAAKDTAKGVYRIPERDWHENALGPASASAA